MEFEDEQITTVTIFNRTYQLRSEGDPEYVRRLAALIDQKMVELSTSTPTVDTVKLAILAALSIADQYIALKDQQDQLKKRVLDSTQRMRSMLKPFLEIESG